MKVEIKAHPNKKSDKPYWWNLGEAVSQALAAVFGLDANLTFSAYSGYWKQEQRPYLRHIHKPINILFRDKEHCQNAWKNRT